jgi:site-specific recombinase XerC
MEDKLNKFLSYLQNEKGFSPGTVEVYQLDLEGRKQRQGDRKTPRPA